MREADFLDQQSEEAKAAMQATLKSLGREALEIVDPARLTREHPWKLVTIAAAAGFAASKFFEPQPPPQESTDPAAPPKTPPSTRKLFRLRKFISVTREIIAVARPILDTLWAAALSAAEAYRTNGDHPPQTPTADPPFPPAQR
jgi:hypothetical protein